MPTMDHSAKPVFEKTGKNHFFNLLNKEVNSTVLKNPKIKNTLKLKSLILLSSFFLSYLCILFLGNNLLLLYFFYCTTGILMILVFLNGFHDAVHGAVFKNKKYNEWYTHILEVFGSNSFIWKKRHLLLHHPYPNLQHWDIDIKQSDLVRIFPESKRFSYHKYQHIYMWFLYLFYTLNWLFIRDFKDFYGKNDNYLKRIISIPKIEYYKLFAAKIINLQLFLGLPVWLLNHPWYTIFSAFLVMHLIASAFGVMSLISAHVDEHAEFPLPPKDGVIRTSWAEYQIRETKDFSTDSKFANFIFGGFNHHVAHHLFPHIAHTYYPHITPIIRRYAIEYNLPYQSFPLFKAIFSHFMLLKKSGRVENLFVAGEI